MISSVTSQGEWRDKHRAIRRQGKKPLVVVVLGALSSFFLCMQKAADLICSANRYRCMQKSWEHLVHRCESVLGRWLAGVRFPRQQLHFQKKKKKEKELKRHEKKE